MFNNDYFYQDLNIGYFWQFLCPHVNCEIIMSMHKERMILQELQFKMHVGSSNPFFNALRCRLQTVTILHKTSWHQRHNYNQSVKFVLFNNLGTDRLCKINIASTLFVGQHERFWICWFIKIQHSARRQDDGLAERSIPTNARPAVAFDHCVYTTY